MCVCVCVVSQNAVLSVVIFETGTKVFDFSFPATGEMTAVNVNFSLGI